MTGLLLLQLIMTEPGLSSASSGNFIETPQALIEHVTTEGVTCTLDSAVIIEEPIKLKDLNQYALQLLLLPIAEKWRELGSEMRIDQKELSQIKSRAKSDEKRLKLLISQCEYQQKNELVAALTKVGEAKIAESVDKMRSQSVFLAGSPHYTEAQSEIVPNRASLPRTKPLLHDIGSARHQFSNSLLFTTRKVAHMPPRELAQLLICFDKRFSALTSNCKDTDDVINVLIENVTLLDSDLLEYLADATDNKALQSDLKTYLTRLKVYLKSKISSSVFIVDRDMGILPDDNRSIVKLEKLLPKGVTITFADVPKEQKGIEVLQMVQVKVGDAETSFEWKGYGFQLKVPSSSMPKNVHQVTITIKISLSGQYQFPDGTVLVSPVFWMSCEPNGTFKKPLNVEIQHCAPPESSHHLFMVKAFCTQKTLPYTFKSLYGATFNKHSSYGVIALNGFSGVGVVQERSEERRYWSSVFYMGPSTNRDIHFTVTWHTDAHVTTIEDRYKRRKALPGPKQTLLFKEDTITLDIPKEGVETGNGWKLYPATPPTISRKEVDDHDPKSVTVPHCELLACWNKDDMKINPLRHTVNILGTNGESYFLVSVTPDMTTGIEDSNSGASSPKQSKLEIRHLYRICECLRDLPRNNLISVGLALGLYYTNLKGMQQLPEDMVEAWLLQRDSVTHPTTETLIQALEKSGFAGTADKVKTNFM